MGFQYFLGTGLGLHHHQKEVETGHFADVLGVYQARKTLPIRVDGPGDPSEAGARFARSGLARVPRPINPNGKGLRRDWQAPSISRRGEQQRHAVFELAIFMICICGM